MFIKLTDAKTNQVFFINTDEIVIIAKANNTIITCRNNTKLYARESPKEIRDIIDLERKYQAKRQYEALAVTLNKYAVFR